MLCSLRGVDWTRAVDALESSGDSDHESVGLIRRAPRWGGTPELTIGLLGLLLAGRTYHWTTISSTLIAAVCIACVLACAGLNVVMTLWNGDTTINTYNT